MTTQYYCNVLFNSKFINSQFATLEDMSTFDTWLRSQEPLCL